MEGHWTDVLGSVCGRIKGYLLIALTCGRLILLNVMIDPREVEVESHDLCHASCFYHVIWIRAGLGDLNHISS